MKKYTDSQILRTIIKQCKRDIEYHNEKVTELGKKKLELIKKREYFEKPVIWVILPIKSLIIILHVLNHREF